MGEVDKLGHDRSVPYEIVLKEDIPHALQEGDETLRVRRIASVVHLSPSNVEQAGRSRDCRIASARMMEVQSSPEGGRVARDAQA